MNSQLVEIDSNHHLSRIVRNLTELLHRSNWIMEYDGSNEYENLTSAMVTIVMLLNDIPHVWHRLVADRARLWPPCGGRKTVMAELVRPVRGQEGRVPAAPLPLAHFLSRPRTQSQQQRHRCHHRREPRWARSQPSPLHFQIACANSSALLRSTTST